jgi:hypothetical protein
LEKLEADAAAKQKLHGKAQSDCRSVLECKKTDNDELKRLDKQYLKVSAMLVHLFNGTFSLCTCSGSCFAICVIGHCS